MSRFWSDVARQLTPYVPGEQPKGTQLLKLNTNENPYGPSPRALEAIHAECAATLRLYPDPEAERVKHAASKCYGLMPDQIFVGNGSDEVLAHVFLALLKHRSPVLMPDVTYSFYEVYCRLYDVPHRLVPLDPSLRIQLEDYLEPNGGIIFANPNAPTGRALARTEIEWLLERNRDSVIVVDEAYVDFGAESVLPLVNRYANLLVVRTLSKSHALAGLRIGLAAGDKGLVLALDRVKNSFNSYPIDRLAIAGAAAALEDSEHLEVTRQAVMRSREALTRGLAGLGFEVLPSAANFVFARHPQRDGAALTSALKQRGILVRHFARPRIEQFLRISIGTDADCETLLGVLGELLACNEPSQA